MRAEFRAAVIATLSIAAFGLTACGGGGGGGSAPVAAALPVAGSKASMVYVPASAKGPGDMIVPGAASDLALNQTATTASVTVAGSGVATGTMTGSCGGGICVYDNIDSNGSNTKAALVTSTRAGTSTLQSTNYGLLLAAPAGGTYIGGVYGGSGTAIAQLPTNVTATYSGSYMGYEVTQSATSAQTGTASLSANFGTGKVSGAVTNLTTRDSATSTSAAAGYGLSMNGTISGGTYSGTAGFLAPTAASGALAPAGTVTASSFNGGFYGANAAETAGAIGIRGTAPTGVATTITGSYGAVKK
jgi:C-lobe and N-lobe beta barrels of Tf-binding protein B